MTLFRSSRPAAFLLLLLFLVPFKPAAATAAAAGAATPAVAKWGHLYLRFGASGMQFYTAAFSQAFPCDELPLVLPEPDPHGCGNFTNGAELRGSIVVVQRGVCSFLEKATNAQRYGAHAVVVLNNQHGLLRMPGFAEPGSVSVSSVMVGAVHAKLITESIVRSRTWALGPVTGVVVGQSLKDEGGDGDGKLREVGGCRELDGEALPRLTKYPDDVAGSNLFAPVHGGLLEVRGGGVALGPFEFLSAEYSGPLSYEWRRLAQIRAPNELACSPLSGAGHDGAAVLVERGGCMFTNKTAHVQNASAAAVILVNSVPGLQRVLGSYEATTTMHVPVAMISASAGALLVHALRESGDPGEVEVRLVLGNSPPASADYDTLNRLSDMTAWPSDSAQRENVVAAVTEQIEESKPATGERLAMLTKLAEEAEQFYEDADLEEL